MYLPISFTLKHSRGIDLETWIPALEIEMSSEMIVNYPKKPGREEVAVRDNMHPCMSFGTWENRNYDSQTNRQ